SRIPRRARIRSRIRHGVRHRLASPRRAGPPPPSPETRALMTRKPTWSGAVLPARLRPGDTIAVPAPAAPVLPEAAPAGLAPGGAAVTGGPASLAGSDRRRADELNRCLRAPDVRAIIPARGGYGVLRILERLDADALRRDPKPIVGFSDMTALAAWSAREAQ